MHLTAAVICHKYEQYVDRAIASLVTQTRQPDAVLLLGTDCRFQTREALEPWKTRHRNIHSAYSKTPLNCPQSKNFVHHVATMETISPVYIEGATMTLDADDWLMPHYVERCMAYLESSDAAVVGCDYQVMDSTGVLNDSHSNMMDIEAIDDENPLPSCSIVRNRSFVSVRGYDDAAIFDDWDLWLRIHMNGERLFRFPQMLFVHLMHGENLGKKQNRQQGVEQIKCKISMFQNTRVN